LPAPQREAGPALRGREQAGRRQQYRHAGGDRLAAGRLHLAADVNANAINASFDPTLPFDFAKGIAPVAGVARIPLVLVVNNDLPVRNVGEFIAYTRANPATLSIASSGIGTSLHLSGELFKALAHVEFTMCPIAAPHPA